MSQRTLYRTLEVNEATSPVQRVEYYLLTDHARFDGGFLEVYGVELVLYREDRRKPEIARIRNVTPIGSRILRILDCLCSSVVTPMGLQEAMEEVLERV